MVGEGKDFSRPFPRGAMAVVHAEMRREGVFDRCQRRAAADAVSSHTGAIAGSVKQPHVIDQAKCVKCGACEATCKFGAISHG